MEVYLIGLGALAAKVLGDETYKESSYVDKLKRRFQADPNQKGAFDSGPSFHSLLKKPEAASFMDKVYNSVDNETSTPIPKSGKKLVDIKQENDNSVKEPKKSNEVSANSGKSASTSSVSLL